MSAEHEAPYVKVGDVVRVRAAFTALRQGEVVEVDATGFRVAGLWFGWHELTHVNGAPFEAKT